MSETLEQVIHEMETTYRQSYTYSKLWDVVSYDVLHKEKIVIIPFQICISARFPFFHVMLYKEPETNLIQFISPKTDGCSLVEATKIVKAAVNSFHSNAEPFYLGNLKHDSVQYLFFDCSSCKIDTHQLHKQNDLWFVTLDEIYNTRSVVSFSIDPVCTLFFRDNKEYFVLLDAVRKPIEVPQVLYSGCERGETKVIATFGLPRTTVAGLDGYYFKFCAYDDVKMNGGVVRYVVFGGSFDDVIQSAVRSDNGVTEFFIKSFHNMYPLTYHIQSFIKA